jgi:hypothetical protein
MGPTGNLIQGHVLDVDRKAFEQAMRFTLNDNQLYTKWNPSKLGGWGCWEIRRRPDFNSALDVSEFEGNVIFKIGPKEYDLVHHVLDCAFLNYDAIRRLKEIDTWQYGNAGAGLEDEIERRTRTRREREKEQAKKELSYMARYYRTEIRGFMEAIRSGVNPHSIAQYWDSAKEAD